MRRTLKSILTLSLLSMALFANAQHGEIFYTDFEPDLCVNSINNTNDTVKIDFDEDGLTDFTMRVGLSSVGASIYLSSVDSEWEFREMGMQEPDTIVPSDGFWGSFGFVNFGYPPVQYIDFTFGFRKRVDNHYYYAWMRMYGYYDDPYKKRACVDKYAYCTIPDYPLRWGQTSLDSVEENNEIHITINPNPTQNLVTITGENLADVEVVDIMGRTVMKSYCDGDKVKIDLSQQPAGVYLFKIADKNGEKCTKKAVKK